MLTSQPPRARKPLTEPSVQPLGSAGNKLISPAWLCSSDSATPAVKPKLASDWLAPLLCRFGATALATNAEMNTAALSPRSRRDQTEIYQTDGNPAPGGRVSIHLPMAPANSGVPRRVIEFPG